MHMHMHMHMHAPCCACIPAQVTYESRLLKYAMRGFAIAVSHAPLDRRLQPYVLSGCDPCAQAATLRIQAATLCAQVSPALLDRNLLDAASFDTGTLMFTSGHTG